jgi:hypothetical protein
MTLASSGGLHKRCESDGTHCNDDSWEVSDRWRHSEHLFLICLVSNLNVMRLSVRCWVIEYSAWLQRIFGIMTDTNIQHDWYEHSFLLSYNMTQRSRHSCSKSHIKTTLSTVLLFSSVLKHIMWTLQEFNPLRHDIPFIWYQAHMKGPNLCTMLWRDRRDAVLFMMNYLINLIHHLWCHVHNSRSYGLNNWNYNDKLRTTVMSGWLKKKALEVHWVL